LPKSIPGFEFLQGLVKNAGAAMPGLGNMASIGQWVAPTLNPQEIDKRIDELRTVQFWLEQNARMITTTIQALEVQRMTLATLQTMKVPLADLRDAIKPSAQGLVDPMQWWGALTQQFSSLAAQTIKDVKAVSAPAAQRMAKEVAKEVAKNMAKGAAQGAATRMVKAVVKQGLAQAGGAKRRAASPFTAAPAKTSRTPPRAARGARTR
jgi:hypothetical protein